MVPYMNEVSWSNGVMEYWSNGLRAHHSNTPLLHHSSFPVTRSLFLSAYTTEPWSPCGMVHRLLPAPPRRSDESSDPRLRIRSDYPPASRLPRWAFRQSMLQSGSASYSSAGRGSERDRHRS